MASNSALSNTKGKTTSDSVAPPTDNDQVATFISNAFALKLKGNVVFYNTLIQQLNKRDDAELLWRVYHGLAASISQFANDKGNRYSDIIGAILSFDWRCDRRTTVAVVHLVSQMVSLNATFASAAFDFFVRAFLSVAYPNPDMQSHGEWLAYKNELVHSAIKSVLLIAPSSSSQLVSSIAHHFPYKRVDLQIQAQYTAQCLCVADYLQSSNRLVILDLILSKCLEMDVEIVIEDSGETKIQSVEGNEEGNLIEDDMFPLDDHDDGYFNFNATKSMRDTSQRIPDAVAEMADKLDSLLVVVVEYINKLLGVSAAPVAAACGSGNVSDVTAMIVSEDITTGNISNCNSSSSGGGGSNSSNSSSSATAIREQDELFLQLLQIFEDKILLTHRSKFVQFIIFYVVGKCPTRFGEALCLRLLKIFYDTHAASIRRQTAVIYLGSLLARCTALNVDFVSNVIEKLISWSCAYARTIHPPIANVGGSPLQTHLRSSRSQGSNLNDLTPTKASFSDLYNSRGDGEVDSYGNFESARKRNKSNDCLSTFQQQEHALNMEPEKRVGFSIYQRQRLFSEVTTEAIHRISSNQSLSTGSGYHVHSEDILDELGRKARPFDSLTLNESFYSCVQSICYVLCFHGTDLATRYCSTIQHTEQWMNILLSPAMPLRFCLHSVRFEFFRLAEFVSLLPDEVLSVLIDFTNNPGSSTLSLSLSSSNLHYSNSNARLMSATNPKSELDSGRRTPSFVRAGYDLSYLLQRSLASPANQSRYLHSNVHVKSANPLDSFFPFDPCLLVNLNHRVEGFYRMWKGIEGLDINVSKAAAVAGAGVGIGLGLGCDDSLPVSRGNSSAITESSQTNSKGHIENDDDDDDDEQEGLDIDDDDESGSQYSSSFTSHSHSRTESNLGISIGSEYTMNSSLLTNSVRPAVQGGIGHGWTMGNENNGNSNSSAAGMTISEDTLRKHESLLSQQQIAGLPPNVTRKQQQQSGAVDANSLHSFATQTSSQSNQNSEWSLPVRRPRQYSIGSTGSW